MGRKPYREDDGARLENNVFPWLGNKAITEIEHPDILDVLRRIESRGVLETAHRTQKPWARFFVTP